MSDKKNSIVTGGSGGIGSELCRALALNGYSVIINYNSNKEKAMSTLQSLKGDRKHNIFKASITDNNDLNRMAEFVKQEYGSLNVLVNNSGITTRVPHDDLRGLTDEWIDKIFQINFRGAFACVRAFEPLLKKNEGISTVVNISSIAGRTGVGSNIAYCASKAALDSMTKSLARALAPKIRVLSLSPGWVWGEYANQFPKEYIQEQEKKTPLGRIANSKDVADALISVLEHFTFTTGCVIPVDGGRPLM